MPKRARELTAVEIRRLVSASKQGVFAVGVISGLYLQIRGITSTSWILRKTIGSKRREIGLGAYPAIGLKEAREKARSFIEQIAQGIDPILERRAQKAAIIASQAKTVTFEQLAQEFINKKSLEFKTSKQTQKLTTMLKSYAYPIIGSMVVSDIERAALKQEFLELLEERPPKREVPFCTSMPAWPKCAEGKCSASTWIRDLTGQSVSFSG